MRTFWGWLGVTVGVAVMGFGMFMCGYTWPEGLGYVAMGAFGSAVAGLSYEEVRR